jgi:hypothetical protein
MKININLLFFLCISIYTLIPFDLLADEIRISFIEKENEKSSIFILLENGKIYKDNTCYWYKHSNNRIDVVKSNFVYRFIFNVNEENEIISLVKGIILKYDKNKILKWNKDLYSIQYSIDYKYFTKLKVSKPEKLDLISNISINNQIKNFVESKIKKWQIKNEFEKISEYNVRVNEYTRSKKIQEFEKNAIDSIKQNYIDNLNFNKLIIGNYDSENETFLFSSELIEDFIVYVPIERARQFKNEFISNNVIFSSIDFIIIENSFVLSSISMKINHQEEIYSFNINNDFKYSKIEISYELDEIKISNDIENYLTNNYNSLKISDIEINIPVNSKKKFRYALIIGNEDYSSFQSNLNKEQNVPFAINDARTFKQYALKTLGVKNENCFYLINATKGQIQQYIDLICKIVSKENSNAELIFYYSGHGYPDEISKTSYIIPVDISASTIENAISIDSILEEFQKSRANKIYCFIDACFSGGSRGNDLLVTRGVKINPKKINISDNIIVMTASSDTQSALSYKEKKHGMFTYFLLKKLQLTKGKVKFGEWFNFVKEKVSVFSLKINYKEQDPKILLGLSIQNKWENWEF